MINIKDDKMYGSNYSFAFPQGFNRVEGLDSFSDDDLVFVSADNDYLSIVIYLKKENQSANNHIQEMFDKNSCLIKLSDCFSIKRGEGEAVGIFYENTFGATQHYIELFDFKENKDGETQVYIDISLWSGREKDRQTIQEVLESPTIKAFLESIKYF